VSYLPMNARTGKPYRKRTRVLLAAWTEETGYSGPLWTTYAGWTELGYKIKRGSRGVLVSTGHARGYILYHASQLTREPKSAVLAEAWTWYQDPAKIAQRKAREAKERATDKEHREWLRIRATHEDTMGAMTSDDDIDFPLWG